MKIEIKLTEEQKQNRRNLKALGYLNKTGKINLSMTKDIIDNVLYLVYFNIDDRWHTHSGQSKYGSGAVYIPLIFDKGKN